MSLKDIVYRGLGGLAIFTALSTQNPAKPQSLSDLLTPKSAYAQEANRTIDNITLAKRVAEWYEKDIKPKVDYKDPPTNAHFIYTELKKVPLESLLDVDPLKLDNNTKHTLAHAFNIYGILHEGMKDRDNAIAYYKKAVQFNPEDYKSLVNIAVLYYLDRDIKNAKCYIKQAYEIAQRLDPTDKIVKDWYNEILKNK